MRTPARGRPRAGRLLLVAAVCALGAVLAVVGRVHQPQVGALSARYVVLAESLTRGTYELTSSPLSEVEVMTPPLWPAALAVLRVLTAAESLAEFVPAAEAITLVLFLALLAVVFAFVAARAGVVAATVVATLSAAQPWLLPYARHPMAEVPFAFLLLSALGLGAVALRRRDGGALTLALALALASAYVRPAGIAVVLALIWCAWDAFPERRRSLVVFAAASLLWPVREAGVLLLGTPTAGTTRETFVAALEGRGYAAAVGESAAYYARALVAAVFPTDLLREPPIRGVLLVALWGLIVLGMARDRGHDRGLASLTFGLILTGLVLWPAHTMRYLVPVLPLALYFAARGLRRSVEILGRGQGLWRRPRPARLAPVLLLALLVPYLRWDLRLAGVAGEASVDESWAGLERTLAWVAARAPRRAVIVTRYPEEAFLLTGRQALPIERALRGGAADSFQEPVWLVKDALGGSRSDARLPAAMISRAGGRIRFVENGSGTEVWLLAGEALERLEELHAEATRA